MARYLLDTTVLIDFSKDYEPARSRILAMIEDDDVLGVCPINVTEFYASLSPDEQVRWGPFIRSLRYWNISRAAAIQAGIYHYTYARQGQAITTLDATVAAVARERQATVVTSNVRHFPMTDI